ncbi:hypothetical protein TBLA_0I00220 [Henningerozyma blattae CBS 6284]|uniref:dTMP kinase n=1 Tax=Henningerozyma blattae (strain ATCC 34711 / CBS 6284 / DSM 70876 / NBRC 10599 / NRRL Y-10934 / UCD 77-7) TaxID=1071380 RepID=I2H8I5_HENB6|nr:hypothetical protein TBLA_0I00220 [Tetrapisispora blattae CBS 6284]CCH62687.1 hypothetical protein TBLA_0I00220 [Tetrapisispora blattae CBS 6284]
MTRGRLILFEGLDRTGKTTQSEALLKYLNLQGDQSSSSKRCELIKFPERSTPIGKLINNYLVDKSFKLPDQSIHLLFSSNRWELTEQIKSSLQKGNDVLLDRYVFSGIAYSLAKDTERMDFDWCLSPDIGLIKPDLTIFLTTDSDISTSNQINNRSGFGAERYEKSDFQLKVKAKFDIVFNYFFKDYTKSSSATTSNMYTSSDGITTLLKVNVIDKDIPTVFKEITNCVNDFKLVTDDYKYF